MKMLASLIAILLPSIACAQCGSIVAVRNRNVVVREKVVVAETVLTPLFVPVATFGATYPAYGAGYYPGPPAPVQQAAPQARQDDPILAELKKINARIDALERRGGGAQPQDRKQEGGPGGAALKFPQVLMTKCAQCHSQSTAQDGGNFAFLGADGPRKMTDQELRKTAKKVKGGQMPPPDNKKGVAALTQEEANAVLDWVEDQ